MEKSRREKFLPQLKKLAAVKDLLVHYKAMGYYRVGGFIFDDDSFTIFNDKSATVFTIRYDDLVRVGDRSINRVIAEGKTATIKFVTEEESNEPKAEMLRAYIGEYSVSYDLKNYASEALGKLLSVRSVKKRLHLKTEHKKRVQTLVLEADEIKLIKETREEYIYETDNGYLTFTANKRALKDEELDAEAVSKKMIEKLEAENVRLAALILDLEKDLDELRNKLTYSKKVGTKLQNDNLAGQDREIERLHKLVENLEENKEYFKKAFFNEAKKNKVLWNIILKKER